MEVTAFAAMLEGHKRCASETSRTGQATVVGRAVVLATAVVLLLGCGIPATYTDVSDNPDFEWLVGKRYRLVEAMNIAGVNLPPGYGDEVDVYFIDPASLLWNGPELISRDTLEVGTVLTVQSIVECCFGTTREAVVSTHPYVVAVAVPIRIDLKYLVDPYVEATD